MWYWSALTQQPCQLPGAPLDRVLHQPSLPGRPSAVMEFRCGCHGDLRGGDVCVGGCSRPTASSASYEGITVPTETSARELATP
jgi:hypothetical protein